MDKESARKQFDEMTERLQIEHTFSFDEAWDFVEFKRNQDLIHKPFDFIPAQYSREEYREFIVKAEEKIKCSEEGITGDKVNFFNPLKHSFAEGCYIREVFNPKGILLITKIHKVTHPYFLLQGDMSILMEDGEKRIKAPHYGITPAGTKRLIYCHEDCVFVTVHVTKETDLNLIEDEIIAKDFDEMFVKGVNV